MLRFSASTFLLVILLPLTLFTQQKHPRKPDYKLLPGREKYPLEMPWGETAPGEFEPIIPSSEMVAVPFPVVKVNQFVTAEPQNEPSLAISRVNRDNIVAAYRDFREGSNPAIRNIGIATTTDDGQTWLEDIAGYSDHDRFSDPFVGVDTSGVYYVVTLSYRQADGGNSNDAFSMRKSDDGGLTWYGTPPAVDENPSTFHDREILAVDNDRTSPRAGNVYVSWTEFGAGTLVYLVGSSDGGYTWSSWARVSDVGNVQMSMPTTAPNGDVYVVWEHFGAPNVVYFDKSTDGGLTFGTDVPVSDADHAPVGFININGGVQTSGYPVCATDKSTSERHGYTYVAWPSSMYGDQDIFVRASSDGGASWNDPVRVNNDPIGNGADQFHQWVTVDDSGWVDVVWLDRRNDSTNILADTYFAQSRDGGQTFRNFRISAQSFDPRLNYNGNTRFGDYMDIDASLGKVAMVSTDSHLGNQDIYMTTIDQRLGTVSGTVFADCNGNGVKDSGESGQPNVTVRIAGDFDADTVTTDASGNYTATHLYQGSFTITATPPQGAAVTLPGAGTFTVSVTPGGHSTGLNFGVHSLNVASAGWNLVGLSRTPADPLKTVLFPAATSPAYRYSTSYENADTLTPGKGYWMKFAGCTSLDVPGDSIIAETLAVNAGWNLISGISQQVDATLVAAANSVIGSPFYTYLHGYHEGTILLPGVGYWVRCSAAGQIIIHASSGPPARIASTVRAVDYSKMNIVTLSDESGSQTLVITEGQSAISAASALPPPPPAGTFDARFTSGRMIESFAENTEPQFKIATQSTSASIKVAWNIVDRNHTYSLGAPDGRVLVNSMEASGSIEIPGAQASSLSIAITKSADRTLPTGYELSQNYPNPFNPETRIAYAIPRITHVRLNVYDVLGRNVATLVDADQLPGNYRVSLDATSLSSGVYYYTLQTTEFTTSRRMLLVR